LRTPLCKGIDITLQHRFDASGASRATPQLTTDEAMNQAFGTSSEDEEDEDEEDEAEEVGEEEADGGH
jgi:hypothetical protein